jgi:hypothetical protein
MIVAVEIDASGLARGTTPSDYLVDGGLHQKRRHRMGPRERHQTVVPAGTGPMTAKLLKVAIDSNRCRGSALASRQLGYLSPEASLSAMLGVQAAGECLVCLESTKVLDA